MHKGYETPGYTVLAQDGPMELRRYGAYLVAEISVAGRRRLALSRGFRALARYIFGGNASGGRIAMTAPVTAQQERAEPSAPWRVRFVVPGRHARADLPAPLDPAVQIAEAGPAVHAVIRFAGAWRDRRLAAQAETLRRWAEGRGLTLDGPPIYSFYDDPFTLPFRRRNEVAFAVAAGPDP